MQVFASLSKIPQVGRMLFLVFFIYHSVLAAEPIKLAAEPIKLVTGAFIPFSGEAVMDGGMSTEIIIRAFAEVGYTTKVDFMPWKRGYQDTLQHKYLGTFPYVKNEEREKLFFYSQPTYAARVFFFVRNDFKIKYSKDEDLKGLTTCVPLGYSTKEIERFTKKELITVQRPLTDEACFKMLEKGRVDLFSVNEITGWRIIHKIYGDTKGFRTLGKPLLVNSYHLIIPKSYPNGKKMIEQFNRGLDKIKQKDLQGIINRHLEK